MSSIYPLAQFEIRFSPILNFNSIIRELLSPYLRMASSFNFANQGKYEESIKINFEEEFYSIDCRWDRVVFVCQEDPSRFSKQNSTMKIFWEIVEKITLMPTFGTLKHSLFVCYEIKVLDESQESIISKFKSKYFTKEIDRIMEAPNELAVILEMGTSTKATTLTFGPYTNEDNKKHNLFPYDSPGLTEITGKFGMLIKYHVFEELKKIDLHLFKNLLESQKKYSANFDN